MQRGVLLVLVVLLALGLLGGAPAQAQTGETNLLVNPSFEEPYSTTPFLKLALGWNPWFSGVQPDFYPEIHASHRWGERAQALMLRWQTFTAGVYQQVNVQRAGLPVRGIAWANIFVCCGSDVHASNSRVRIGIDPNGGTDPFDSDVVWSAEISPLFHFEELTVETVSTGPTVTLFLYGTQSSPAEEHRQFWDDAFVIVPGGVPTTVPAVTPTIRVNVRSGPGTNYERIGRIDPGQLYALLGQVGSWYNIDFNGQSGYIAAEYAQVTEMPSGGGVAAVPGAPAAAAAPAGANAPGVPSGVSFLTGYNVRMRAAPNESAPVIATIPYQTWVDIVERTADYSWLRVNYNGASGWVAARLGRTDIDLGLVPVAP
jgi:uncharacterized protein YraI